MDTGEPVPAILLRRCRLIDLGAWASEEHRIAGDESAEFDQESGD